MREHYHVCSRQQFPSAPNPATLRTSLNIKPTIPAWQMSTEQSNSSQEEQEQSGNKVPAGVTKSLTEDSPDVNGHSAANVEDSTIDNDANGASPNTLSNGNALMSEVTVE